MSSSTRYTIPNPSGASLGNDADPNTTAPVPNRVFHLAKPPAVPQSVWVAATGGAPTVQLWMFVPELSSAGRWVKIGAALALLADAAQVFALGAIPTSCDLTIQVTAHDTATEVCLGVTQD